MFNFSNLKSDPDTYTYVRNLTIATVLLQTAVILALFMAPTLLSGWIFYLFTCIPVLTAFLIEQGLPQHENFDTFDWLLVGNGLVYAFLTGSMLIPSIITTALLAITVIYMVTTPQSDSVQYQRQPGQNETSESKSFNDPSFKIKANDVTHIIPDHDEGDTPSQRNL